MPILRPLLYSTLLLLSGIAAAVLLLPHRAAREMSGRSGVETIPYGLFDYFTYSLSWGAASRYDARIHWPAALLTLLSVMALLDLARWSLRRIRSLPKRPIHS